MLTIVSAFTLVGGIDAEEEGVSITWAEYLPDEGKVSFTGTASSDYVNVLVVGPGFESQVKPCNVVNGSFTGIYKVGNLSSGTYQVVVKTPDCIVSRNMTVSDVPPITIASVGYNPVDGKVSFAGTASSDYVNVLVVGPGFESQVKPCNVVDGSYSGAFKIGDVAPGTYRLVVRSLEADKTSEFMISNEPIVISSVTFDPSDARVTVMGKIYQPDIGELVLEDPNGLTYYSSLWVDKDDTFVSYFHVGRLTEGVNYQIKLPDSEPILYESVYTNPIDSTQNMIEGNILSDNGSTLIRFTGSVNQYRLPASVTKVSDGAFKNCSVGTFILDRDVHWEISVYDGMSYPFQNSSLSGLIIKEGVTTIPDYLFAKTGITSVELPSSVKTVGKKSFYDCDNVSELKVRDNSCLTLLGDYSFSHSSGLTTITFGSSADGYRCDLGMAVFLYSSNIRDVRLSDDFYLRSIGALCFTKELKIINSSPVEIYAINFNADKGIVIPKEVEEIGNLAFSTMRENRNIVPDIGLYDEPLIGTYTYKSDSYVAPGGVPSLIGENFSISFEEGSQITSIGKGAFGDYLDNKVIDLSNCSKLKVLQRYAFSSCLNNGLLLLPPNIEELYESFDHSFGQLNYETLPDSLRICDNALAGIFGKIAVSSNSQLEYWSDNMAGPIEELDLTGAKHLSYVYTGCIQVSLPAGIFDGNVTSGKLKDKAVGPIANADSIEIKDTTTVLSWKQLSLPLICSEDNPYFKDENGAVYFENGDICKLLQVRQSDVFVLKSNVQVREGILGQTIIDLILGEGSDLDTNALSNCVSLQTLKIIGPFDETMLESSLNGISVYPKIVVSTEVSKSDVMRLSIYGQVYYYLTMGQNTVVVPAIYDGEVIHYEVGSDDSLNVDMGLNGLSVSSSGVRTSVDGHRITLSDINTECYLWFVDIADYSDKLTVTLIAEGGSFDDCDTEDVTLKLGSTISSITHQPERNLNDFIGWSLEPNGVSLSNSYVLSDGLVLYALWNERNPKIFIDNEAATIYCGNDIFGSTLVNSGSNITLIAEPKSGYELLSWVVNGVVSGTADQPLTCSDITDDTYVSLTFRYFSPSSGLNSVSNRLLPTTSESDDLVKVTELGGIIDTSMSVWQGTASVPLIVEDRIYFRAGPWLYAAESDTGYIIASVASAEAKDFYHQLGYGAGVIIDYKTGKAYDLDLNQLFVLPNQVTGAEYYDGLFYTSGKDVYSFTATDDDPNSSSEVKTMTFVGHINNVYSSYGFSRSVFVDHYIYRVIVDGKERGIAAMDLETGSVQTKYLQSIRSMFLDDAWISYNEGYIYLPGYVSGLFGEVATEGWDTLAFVKVDGLNFGTEEHYTFEGKRSWPSETLFYNGKAYILAGQLYCFDLTDGKISGDPRTIGGIATGHGSMVMEVGYNEAGEESLYFYVIPYSSISGKGMTIIEDREGVFSVKVVYGLPQNYNSQAVRADIDGRMIWYNDSGHIYNYTTPEKNVYYFFIEDGEHAQWYEAHGRNAAEALKSLGGDIISLDDYKRVTSIFGKATDKPIIKVLNQNNPADMTSNLMSYSWITLNDLYDRSYDTCHYYRIIASGNGTNSFSYIDDDGTVSTYTFQNNIGDGRKVLGKMLVPGNDCAKIRFFNGDTELTDLAMIYSKSAGASWNLPSMIRNETDVVWTTSSGDAVTSLVQATAGKTDMALYGTWPVSSADLSKDVTVSVEGNVKTVTVALSEQEGTVYLKSVVRDGSGFTEETYELKESDNWTKTMTVSEGTEGMLLYLVRSPEQSFADSIGCALLTEGAGL